MKNCLSINHKKSALFPEQNEYINCQNFKRFKIALFTIYRDFECVLIFSSVDIYVCPNDKKYSIILFHVLATCIDEQHSKLHCITFVKVLYKNL